MNDFELVKKSTDKPTALKFKHDKRSIAEPIASRPCNMWKRTDDYMRVAERLRQRDIVIV